tara:strand:- start:3517 stop:3843 length:327 start_codon:yes stop_codon:yes gene_type:complete
MDDVNELHIVKHLLEEEINFLDKYYFYAEIFKRNKNYLENDDKFLLLNEYYQHLPQASSIINKRKDLLTRINLEIEKNCNHVWETDLIDIDPDKSMTIHYCTKCEKNL